MVRYFRMTRTYAFNGRIIITTIDIRAVELISYGFDDTFDGFIEYIRSVNSDVNGSAFIFSPVCMYWA